MVYQKIPQTRVKVEQPQNRQSKSLNPSTAFNVNVNPQTLYTANQAKPLYSYGVSYRNGDSKSLPITYNSWSNIESDENDDIWWNHILNQAAPTAYSPQQNSKSNNFNFYGANYRNENPKSVPVTHYSWLNTDSGENDKIWWSNLNNPAISTGYLPKQNENSNNNYNFNPHGTVSSNGKWNPAVSSDQSYNREIRMIDNKNQNQLFNSGPFAVISSEASTHVNTHNSQRKQNYPSNIQINPINHVKSTSSVNSQSLGSPSYMHLIETKPALRYTAKYPHTSSHNKNRNPEIQPGTLQADGRRRLTQELKDTNNPLKNSHFPATATYVPVYAPPTSDNMYKYKIVYNQMQNRPASTIASDDIINTDTNAITGVSNNFVNQKTNASSQTSEKEKEKPLNQLPADVPVTLPPNTNLLYTVNVNFGLDPNSTTSTPDKASTKTAGNPEPIIGDKNIEDENSAASQIINVHWLITLTLTLFWVKINDVFVY